MTNESARIDDVHGRMRSALTTALKAKDRVAIAALRSAIGALDNAEAIDVATVPSADGSRIAGATVGLGSTEATRRSLTSEDIARVLAVEVDERRSEADRYERAGQRERADTLRAEADVLTPYAS